MLLLAQVFGHHGFWRLSRILAMKKRQERSNEPVNQEIWYLQEVLDSQRHSILSMAGVLYNLSLGVILQ
jgi:hypothetical protein